jgi:hypothetical protein
LKPLDDYATCRDLIAKQIGQTPEAGDSLLWRLVLRAVRGLRPEPPDEYLVEQITDFLAYLNQSPITWSVQSWIEGVWLKSEQIALVHGIVIRRPTPEDFERAFRSEALVPFGPLHHQFPSAIVEFESVAISPIEIQSRIERLWNALRLFRTGSVVQTRLALGSASLTRIGGIHTPGSLTGAPYRYGLGEEDGEPLRTFITRIDPLIVEMSGLTGDPHPDIATHIAFLRYKEAIGPGATSLEARITAAITSLEALYLTANEQGELTHRLAQRVSALMRLFGDKPIETYHKLLRAYDVRSRYIHGSSSTESPESMQSLAEVVLKVARRSIAVNLQIEQELPKDRLVSSLDNSLLDDTALERLRRHVAGVLAPS